MKPSNITDRRRCNAARAGAGTLLLLATSCVSGKSAVDEMGTAPSLHEIEAAVNGRHVQVYSAFVSDAANGPDQVVCLEIASIGTDTVWRFLNGCNSAIEVRIRGEPIEPLGFHALPLHDRPGWSSRMHLRFSVKSGFLRACASPCAIAQRGGLSEEEFNRARSR